MVFFFNLTKMVSIKVLFRTTYFLLPLFYMCQSEEDCFSQEKIANKKIEDKVTKTLLNIGPKQCSKLCSTISGCLSFNYERRNFSCILNYANHTTDNLVTDTEVDYYNKDLSKSTNKGCSQITCPKYSQCIDVKSKPHCVIIECPEPAAINNSVLHPGYNIVGKTRHYACAVYHIAEGSTSVTCLASGKWSSTTLYCKPYIQSCTELKACNSNYGNGEYWLYPVGANNTKIKIYCDKMSTNQPVEYITLPHANEIKHNYSSLTNTNPCTWTLGTVTRSLFHKIRISPRTMVVIRNDKTFTTQTVDPTGVKMTPDYAFGIGCAAESSIGTCQKTGYIRIDTTGTGLLVSPKVTFKFSGYLPVPGSLSKSNDGLVIEVRCDGYCGHCFPNGDLILIPSNIPVPDSSALYPQCS